MSRYPCICQVFDDERLREVNRVFGHRKYNVEVVTYTPNLRYGTPFLFGRDR